MREDGRGLSTFRLHLLITTSITTLVFIVVIAISLFLPLATHLDRQVGNDAMSAGIAAHFLYLHAAFWPVALCSLCGCVASALLLYRRMVGPLAQFVRCFDAIGRRESPNEISIRATDYLGPQVASLNLMIVAIREQNRERTESLAELDSIADEILERSEDHPEVSELVSRIRCLKGLC